MRSIDQQNQLDEAGLSNNKGKDNTGLIVGVVVAIVVVIVIIVIIVVVIKKKKSNSFGSSSSSGEIGTNTRFERL